MSSVLQQAWDRAQPKLASIRKSLHSQTLLKSRIIRVGQLDSELLDQELVQLLKEPLNKAFALVDASLRSRFDPELTLLIQLTLYKSSIWNRGASYGAKLQDLRYVAPPSVGRVLTPSGIPRQTLLIHGTLTIILPYLHTRLRTYALSNSWPDVPSSDRRRRAWGALTTLESSHALLALLSFIVFLWDGRYRTIVDRLLNLTLVPSSRLLKRDVSYEFMNRQMVWHAFTEFLLFLLPLISGRSIRRHLMRLVASFDLKYFYRLLFTKTPSAITGPEAQKTQKRGRYWSMPADQCAICAENASFNLDLTDPTNSFALSFNPTPQSSLDEHAPSSSDRPRDDFSVVDGEQTAYLLYTPYHTSCGHTYCYHCLAERMMRAAEEEELWECLRCGEAVRSADRFLVGIGNDSEISGSEFELSDTDVTDLSGSFTSHSE